MPRNNCGQYVNLFINGYVKARGIDPIAIRIVIVLKFKSINKAQKHNIKVEVLKAQKKYKRRRAKRFLQGQNKNKSSQEKDENKNSSVNKKNKIGYDKFNEKQIIIIFFRKKIS